MKMLWIVPIYSVIFAGSLVGLLYEIYRTMHAESKKTAVSSALLATSFFLNALNAVLQIVVAVG